MNSINSGRKDHGCERPMEAYVYIGRGSLLRGLARARRENAYGFRAIC